MGRYGRLIGNWQLEIENVKGCSPFRSAGSVRDLLSDYRGGKRHQPRRRFGDVGLAKVQRAMVSQDGRKPFLGTRPSHVCHRRRSVVDIAIRLYVVRRKTYLCVAFKL